MTANYPDDTDAGLEAGRGVTIETVKQTFI
jgi:hypothetical protein